MKTNAWSLRALGLVAVFMIALVLTGTVAGRFNRDSVDNQLRQPVGTSASPPQRWEYRIIQNSDTNILQSEANRLGELGYEAFAYEGLTIVLKRPKP